MANPITRLVRFVFDRTSAKKVEQEAKGTTQKISSGLDKLKKAAIAAGAALLAAFSLRAIARFANDVDEARRTLIRLTGAAGDALTTLQRDTRAVFAQVPESIGEVATAIGNLNTLLGVTGTPLQQITKSALDFARANAVDVASSTQLVGQLINRYGLSAAEAVPFMDRLTVAGQMTGASVTDLAQRLLESGTVLSQLGFSINEQIAFFSEFERRGIKTTEAAAAMNRMFTSLSKEGFTDGAAAFQEFIRRIQDAPSDLAAGAIAAEAFGQRAGAKLAVDIRAGVFAVDELTAALQDADGALADTEARGRTAQDELKTAANALKATLAPAVSAVTTAITGAVRGITWFVEGWQDAVGTAIRANLVIEQATLKTWIFLNKLVGREVADAERQLRNTTQLLEDLREEAARGADELERLGENADIDATVKFDLKVESTGDLTSNADTAALAALADEARRIMESVRTPQEVYAEEMARLNSHLDARRISLETFNRAAADAAEKLHNALKETPEVDAEAIALARGVRTPQEIYDDEVARLATFLEQKRITQETHDRALAEAAAALADAQRGPVEEIQERLAQNLAASQTMAAALGDEYNATAQEVNLLTGAMQQLAAEGIQPQDEAMQALAGRLRQIQAESEQVTRQHQVMQSVAESTGAVLNAAFGAGIGQLAAGKAKQNAIMAAEQAVMGLVASLNPFTAPKAAGHFAAAKSFAAIATAWTGLAATTGGFSGGAMAGTGGFGAGRDAAGLGAGRLGQTPSELHVHFTGEGFDAVNPRVQRVVYGALQEAQASVGPNARVRIYRDSTLVQEGGT